LLRGSRYGFLPAKYADHLPLNRMEERFAREGVYETGKYSTIQFTWSDSAKQLTIGARNGSYTGMPANRTFNIVWVGANHGVGLGVTATPDKVVTYNGSATVVTAN
jgi:hypothetical protein